MFSNERKLFSRKFITLSIAWIRRVWSTEHTWVGKLVEGWFTEKCLFYDVWKIRREDTRMKNKVDRSLYHGGREREKEYSTFGRLLWKTKFIILIYTLFFILHKKVARKSNLSLIRFLSFRKISRKSYYPMKHGVYSGKQKPVHLKNKIQVARELHSWLSHSAPSSPNLSFLGLHPQDTRIFSKPISATI